MALAIIAIGCGPSPSSTASPEKAAAPAKTKPAKSPAKPMAAKPKPKPAAKKAAPPKPPAPRPKPLLLNTSFELYRSGAPVDWRVNEKGILEQSLNALDGKHVLALTGLKEKTKWGIVSQPVTLRKKDLGKTLVITAKTKAHVPGQLFMGVEYTVKGKKKTVREPADTGDDWKTLTVKAPLPKNADPKSVRLRFLIRPGAKGKFLIDAIQANLKG